MSTTLVSSAARGYGEAGTLHVLGVGGPVAAQSAQPGKDVLADDGIHVTWLEVLEVFPAVVLEATFLAVFSLGKEALLHWLLGLIGLQFLCSFLLIQTLEKQQIR